VRQKHCLPNVQLFLAYQRAYQASSSEQADEHGRKMTKVDEISIFLRPFFLSSLRLFVGLLIETSKPAFLNRKVAHQVLLF